MLLDNIAYLVGALIFPVIVGFYFIKAVKRVHADQYTDDRARQRDRIKMTVLCGVLFIMIKALFTG